MPHLFTYRPRRLSPHRPHLAPHLQVRWETLNALVYVLGGVTFIVGSVFFLPRFEAHAAAGAWTFVAGSLLYLLVTGHDLTESIRYVRSDGFDLWQGLELTASALYLVGTLLFLVGSCAFIPSVGRKVLGAWCFIVGSGVFVTGSFANVIQIVRARSWTSLQLMNATSITFVLGSVLFAVASVPYLWQLNGEHAGHVVRAYAAWQFIVGSGFFLLGGLFGYWRTEHAKSRRASPNRQGSTGGSAS